MLFERAMGRIERAMRIIAREEVNRQIGNIQMCTLPVNHGIGQNHSNMMSTNDVLKKAERDIQEIIESLEVLTQCDVDSIRWDTKHFNDDHKRIMIRISTKEDDTE